MQTQYVVAGMSCEHCVNSVTTALTQLDGVTAIDIDLESGQVSVTSTSPLVETDVRDAVDEAGYDLVGVGKPAAV